VAAATGLKAPIAFYGSAVDRMNAVASSNLPGMNLVELVIVPGMN
jgi:hypothetical protein